MVFSEGMFSEGIIFGLMLGMHRIMASLKLGSK